MSLATVSLRNDKGNSINRKEMITEVVLELEKKKNIEMGEKKGKYSRLSFFLMSLKTYLMTEEQIRTLRDVVLSARRRNT